jgi:hypothetical protein
MYLDPAGILATLALSGGAAAFILGWRDLNLRRLIQNTPTARIRSLAMGMVEIAGEVSARSHITAPFSGRPCAYWEVDISTHGQRGSDNVVHQNASVNPFFVRDKTGVALVYPHDAKCTVKWGIEEACSGAALPECYDEYMKTLGPSQVRWRTGTLRFRERTLEDGMGVFVLGTAAPRAQSLSISDGDELAATGTDGSGAQRLRTFDHEVSAVIRRGEADKTFIISQKSERDLTTELGFMAFAKLVGGPILAALGIWYWLYAFSLAAAFR